jgi:integrase
MATLKTKTQIKNAPKGRHSVATASGSCEFKKDADTAGVGSYFVRYTIDGERGTMGLGAFDEIEPAAACEEAAKARKLAKAGVDPRGERERVRTANLAAERAKQPVIFKQSAETHLEAHAPSWKHKYARATWFNSVKKYAYPILGDIPTNDIVATHVAAVVRAAAADGNLATGKLVQQRIRKIMNGAIARGERDPLRGNPADAGLVGAIVPLKCRTVHFRRIELDDAPATFRAIREAAARAEGLRAAELDAWVLMISCGSRPSEALYARWGEISLDKKLWVIGLERMKSGREHRTPLSSLATEILERRLELRTSDLVFAGPGGARVGYTNFALGPQKAGIDAGSAHSWRSVFSDWRGGKTAFARELAEFQLAHALPGVAGDYQRETAPERRRELVEAYSRWLVGAEANIIAFPARA